MDIVSTPVCGGENIISFGAELAVVIGVNEAIFLHRLDQLLTTELCLHENERKWVCKTIADWQHGEFPFWSESTIKRIVHSLVRQDFIITIKAEGKKSFDHTKAYTIDYDRLNTFCRSLAYPSLAHE